MSWDAKDADEKFKDLSARGITRLKDKLNTEKRPSIHQKPIKQAFYCSLIQLSAESFLPQ
ncbi:MAG: hypothetical protein LW832_11050 [Parachlamydia sp.]|nr:hypothetical protein [Parachlamydia sp.]